MSRVKNVAEWLDASAQRFPDKIAFSDGTNSLTFAELRDAARRIGSELARRRLFKQPILIALDNKPQAIATCLGCAYSNNFYTPMETSFPAEYQNKIVNKLNPALIITQENYSGFLNKPDDTLLQQALSRQIDTDILYVRFTSGSTGTPKGVAVQHRGVIDYVYTLREIFNFNEQNIFGYVGGISSDSMILTNSATLLCGSTTYFIPKVISVFATKMVDFLNEYKINTTYFTPTNYAILAKSGILKKHKPQYLTKCLFVGEVMSNSILNIWRKALPDALYANLMGPTEITDTYCYYIVDREFADDEPLPVGKAYSNVDVLILNEQNELCQTNEVGELCVRGSKLACGYYNDPEKTAEVFVQNPLNTAYPETIYRTGDLGYINKRGEIIFVGRKDFQIKHTGYRIELGEIELLAGKVEGVNLCCCVYDQKRHAIVLFYTGLQTNINAIKQSLREQLPQYKIPSKFIHIETMPQTPLGKINRQALLGTLYATHTHTQL